MRPDPAGQRPATSTTARHAEKVADRGISPALARRAVSALANVSGMRREDARRIVVAYASDSPSIATDGWSSWLRNWLQIADPTGETAVRNVMRGGQVAS